MDHIAILIELLERHQKVEDYTKILLNLYEPEQSTHNTLLQTPKSTTRFLIESNIDKNLYSNILPLTLNTKTYCQYKYIITLYNEIIRKMKL